VHTYEEMVDRASATVLSEEFAEPGDVVVVSAGIPFAQAGTTNNLRVVQLARR
jgi:pyruvate kinase